MCGYFLIGLSYALVAITFPVSACCCIKVSIFSYLPTRSEKYDWLYFICKPWLDRQRVRKSGHLQIGSKFDGRSQGTRTFFHTALLRQSNNCRSKDYHFWRRTARNTDQRFGCLIFVRAQGFSRVFSSFVFPFSICRQCDNNSWRCCLFPNLQSKCFCDQRGKCSILNTSACCHHLA